MKKKESFIKKNYAECKKVFIELKYYILFTLITFCFFIVVGFGLPIFFKEEIIKMLMNLVNIFEGKGLAEVIIMIFYNNAKACFLSLFLGILLGFIPLMILIVNGYIIGFTSRIAAEKYGLLVLWRLLPHGIFELPAILISVAMGIKLGMVLLKERKNIKKEIIKSLKFYLLIIIPLLIIAAIIEGLLVFLVE